MYSRRGCELCDDMLDALEPYCRRKQVCVEVVDIDSDPDLQRRYASEVPVLVASGREICRHRLDSGALEDFLVS